MLRRVVSGLSTLGVLGGVLAFASSPALATTMHTDVFTGGFEYVNIEETSTFGDPEPLYAGWTPGQYLSILATVVGIAMLAWVLQAARRHANA